MDFRWCVWTRSFLNSLSHSKKLMPTALMDSSVCVNVAAALVTGRQQHDHPVWCPVKHAATATASSNTKLALIFGFIYQHRYRNIASMVSITLSSHPDTFIRCIYSKHTSLSFQIICFLTKWTHIKTFTLQVCIVIRDTKAFDWVWVIHSLMIYVL